MGTVRWPVYLQKHTLEADSNVNLDVPIIWQKKGSSLGKQRRASICITDLTISLQGVEALVLGLGRVWFCLWFWFFGGGFVWLVLVFWGFVFSTQIYSILFSNQDWIIWRFSGVQRAQSVENNLRKTGQKIFLQRVYPSITSFSDRLVFIEEWTSLFWDWEQTQSVVLFCFVF